MILPEIMRDTAAFISTYNEGPFLGHILKWLVPLVPRIYVAESRSTFSGNVSDDFRMTHQVVRGVCAEVPGAEKVIQLIDSVGEEHPDPSVKETSERNSVMDRIRQDGFRWVWVIDADEVYCNGDAEGLWNWFEDVVSRNPEVMGARCSMLTYWRSMRYRIEPPEPLRQNVILRSDCRIASIRHTVNEKFIVDVPPGVCTLRHYSWVRTPSSAKSKMATWGHAHQVLPGWFDNVFSPWTPTAGMKNLHPTDGRAYAGTVRCERTLPECVANHPWIDLEVVRDVHEFPMRVYKPKVRFTNLREPVGVSILTNGARLPYLKRCVETLLENCCYRPLVVGILDNGSTDGTKGWLETLKPAYGIEWRVKSLEKDAGCAKGTNESIRLVRDCELQLHLESDFELLGEAESGHDKMWLHRAVELLKSGECEYLYLRRMRDEREMRMHWWSQWLPHVNKEMGEFLRCPDFWWSNNPTLFRLRSLEAEKVLPLREEIDGSKGTPGWSQPELRTARPPKAWLHRWGVFVHERQPGEQFIQSGCGHGYPLGCKYGFWKDGKDRWCELCKHDKDYKDLYMHDAHARTQGV